MLLGIKSSSLKLPRYSIAGAAFVHKTLPNPVLSFAQFRPYSSAPQQKVLNYFKLFPKVFPNEGPPRDDFKINLRLLRKEYLKLQAGSHPDILIGSNQLNLTHNEFDLNSEDDIIAENSKILNKAYSTLKSPLTRSQHYLQLNGIDIINDEAPQEESEEDPSGGLDAERKPAGASLFKKIASSDQELLLTILDIHEQLESCRDQEELKDLKQENDERIVESENLLNELYKNNDLDQATIETIKLNYWFNIKNAIKEWEPGKKVNLTH